MEHVLSLHSVGLYIILVLPGAVSVHVYRLIMLARPIQWSELAISGLFYLETVVAVDEDGTFGDAIEGSAGLLIRRDAYRYVELFDVPAVPQE